MGGVWLGQGWDQRGDFIHLCACMCLRCIAHADWLLTVAVAVIIVLKRGEVDAADSAASSAPAEPAFPSANPAYPPTMYVASRERVPPHVFVVKAILPDHVVLPSLPTWGTGCTHKRIMHTSCFPTLVAVLVVLAGTRRMARVVTDLVMLAPLPQRTMACRRPLSTA